MPLTQLIDIPCFSTHKHCHALRDQTFTHAADKHIHKRCACHEPLVICPDGPSLLCQDKAHCPLMVMPSARWRIVFLFKQTRGSIIHFLHRSWHEHTEVYSHDPPEALPVCRYHTGTISLLLAPSHCPSLAQCKKKSNQVQDSPRSLCSHCFALYGAPLVTSIILAYKAKLLEQTCIMRRQKNTQGK